MNEEERETFLNIPHLPEDAGEYADGLMDIMNRIPLGWGRWISCGPGWYSIITEANEQLKFIDPDYELQQVKEKGPALSRRAFSFIWWRWGDLNPRPPILH